jgi:hypothetical protein
MIDQPIAAHCQIARWRSRFPYQYSTLRPFCQALGLKIGSGLLLGLAGCHSPTVEPVQFSSADFAAEPLQAAAQQVQSRLVWLVPPAEPLAITLYRLDNRCENFTAEPIQVSQRQPLTDTVGRILAEQNFLAFDLSGYRLLVDAGAASLNIDFRLDPESERVMRSLSSCEQLALFGSLRKTLLENPALALQSVTFSQRGEPLVF